MSEKAYSARASTHARRRPAREMQQAANLTSDEWLCSICCECLLEPVVTPCGHAFDRACLRRWTDEARGADREARCPICRTALPKMPLTVCGTLQRALEAIAPPELVERKAVMQRLEQLMLIVEQDDVASLQAQWNTSTAAAQRSLLQARGSDGGTVLHRAVGAGSVDALRFLLACGADVETKRDDGRTPFALARDVATFRLLHVQILLLSADALFRGLDELLAAAIDDDRPLSLVHAILTAGAQPTGSMLAHAVSAANAELVSELLNCRAWIRVRFSPTPGHGDQRLARLEDLLSHDAYEPVEGRAELWTALARLLTESPELRTHLVVPEEYALPLTAAQLPPTDAYEWYYYDGVDERSDCPPWEGYYLSERLGANRFFPLHVAAALGDDGIRTLAELLPHAHEELVEMPDVCEQSAYHHAARSGSVGALRLLLGKVADGEVPNLDKQDEDGMTALMIAASKGASDVVTELLARGADANITEYADGSTALHLAARALHPGAVSALTEGGARVNAEDDDEFTPLLLAAGARDLRVFDEEAGKFILIVPSADTPAVEASRLATVRTLLRAGAQPSHTTSRNFLFPLVTAVCHTSLSVVEALLQAGAPPCRRDVDYDEWRERSETCAARPLPSLPPCPLASWPVSAAC